MSQKRLCGLTNPFVTSESNFGGFFWLGIDSVFLDCLWVNRGCVAWRIHSSAAKAVSRAIFEWTVTQISLTLCESTGAVWANESIHHLWKHFRGLFLSGQRLSFPYLFMSQQGLCGLTNPFNTSESNFEGYFWLAATQFSLTVYESTGVVWLTNPFVTC